jgi:hypothetical protein
MLKILSVSLALVVASASAFAGELNVQGGSSTGGNASTIVGSNGQLLRFSVTGAFNDVASVNSRFGPFASLSVRDLATRSDAQLAPLVRYSVQKLGDGQTRVFLGVRNASPVFNGGNVTLRRGNAVVDSDPIVIR